MTVDQVREEGARRCSRQAPPCGFGLGLECCCDVAVARAELRDPGHRLDPNLPLGRVVADELGGEQGVTREPLPAPDRIGCTAGGAEKLATRHLASNSEERRVGHRRDDRECVVTEIGARGGERDELAHELLAELVGATPPCKGPLGRAGRVERDKRTAGGLGQFEQRNGCRGVVGHRREPGAEHGLGAFGGHDHPERVVTRRDDSVAEKNRIARRCHGDPRIDPATGEIEQEDLALAGNDHILAGDADTAADAVAADGA